MAERNEPEPKRLEVRKYPNRRYYDTTRSRHLTLDEIRSLVQQGCDLRVTDSKTGLDITPQVLTQIILELETPKLDLFPVPLLVRMIRVNDQLVKDFIEKYFDTALRSFVDYQQQFEQSLRKVPGMPLYSPVSAWTKAMLHPFTSAFADEKASPGPQQPPQLSEETLKLLALIRDLQLQVEDLKKTRGSKVKAKRPSGKKQAKS